jgi:hypothetical protein
MKRSLRIVVVALAALALQGCSAGFSDKFTETECREFTGKWIALSGMESSGLFKAGEMDEMRTGLVQECVAGKMGLSRAELECGNKAHGLDEFRACNIVIRG